MIACAVVVVFIILHLSVMIFRKRQYIHKLYTFIVLICWIIVALCKHLFIYFCSNIDALRNLLEQSSFDASLSVFRVIVINLMDMIYAIQPGGSISSLMRWFDGHRPLISNNAKYRRGVALLSFPYFFPPHSSFSKSVSL